MIVSNIGVYPDLSAIYTTNASMNTAFVQISLKEDHSIGSYEYMRRVQDKLSREMPELYYLLPGRRARGRRGQSGTARADRYPGEFNGYGRRLCTGQKSGYRRSKPCPNVSGVYIPQDLNYPGSAIEH